MTNDTMSQDTATKDDLARIEVKLDKLGEAVGRLILIEERQGTQGQRIGAIEQRAAVIEAQAAATDRKLDSWINRGVGAWALAAAAWAVFKFTKGAQ